MSDNSQAAGPSVGRIRERAQAFIQRFKRIAPLLIVALISFGGVILNRMELSRRVVLTAEEVGEIAAVTMATATAPPAISAQVYESILPSVVIVQTENAVEGGPGFTLGGGVIINEDGLILTSLHVVVDATVIRVSYADGTSSLAILADQDEEKDIAVLEPATAPSIIVPATIGRVSSVRIGDEIFVVGNPLGLMGSMTAGVISGIDRTFSLRGSDQPLEGLFQFDAAINPGNSGGPLLNRDGHLIGIVTGLLSPMEQDTFIGIGFAVPIDVAASSAGSPPY